MVLVTFVMMVDARLVRPVILKLVPVALVNVIAARPATPEAEIFVVVTLVNVVLPKLETPETYKFVEVTPIPTTDRPPIIVVETPTEPIWIPPTAALLAPINMVVVPEPVAIFTVLDVPVPSARVWLNEELPTVIVPVPSAAPMVRAAAADDGLILTTEMFVPVALEKARIPILVGPDTNKLVVVAEVEEENVKKALVEVMLLPADPFKFRPLET